MCLKDGIFALLTHEAGKKNWFPAWHKEYSIDLLELLKWKGTRTHVTHAFSKWVNKWCHTGLNLGTVAIAELCN